MISRSASQLANLYSHMTDVLTFNAATLSGAIDIIVIKHDDGTFTSTPFHVRFGKLQILKSREKLVSIAVNNQPVPYTMTLGQNGDAFFVREVPADDDNFDGEVVTSPAVSPVSPLMTTVAANGKDPTSEASSLVLPVVDLEQSAYTNGGNVKLTSDSLNGLHAISAPAAITQTTTAVPADIAVSRSLSTTPPTTERSWRDYLGFKKPPPIDTAPVAPAKPTSPSPPSEQANMPIFTMIKDDRPLLVNSASLPTPANHTHGPAHSSLPASPLNEPTTPVRSISQQSALPPPILNGHTQHVHDMSQPLVQSPVPVQIQREDSDAAAPKKDKDIGISVRQRMVYRKTLVPTSAMLSELGLQMGCNEISFTVSSALQGVQTVYAWVYVYPPNVKLIVSDIDGTITKSDILGNLMPLVGRDWSHGGVTKLYSLIHKNGYEFIYLTSRAIGQANVTRGYIHSLRQGVDSLPAGPIIMSPDRLIQSFRREVIDRKPQEFKIVALRQIQSLFDETYAPFYAGFGNRMTDVVSYTAVGIATSKIFIINPASKISHMNTHYSKNYHDLAEIVDNMFPATDARSGAELEYNEFQYWRDDIPDIDEILSEKSAETNKQTLKTKAQQNSKSNVVPHSAVVHNLVKPDTTSSPAPVPSDCYTVPGGSIKVESDHERKVREQSTRSKDEKAAANPQNANALIIE